MAAARATVVVAAAAAGVRIDQAAAAAVVTEAPKVYSELHKTMRNVLDSTNRVQRDIL